MAAKKSAKKTKSLKKAKKLGLTKPLKLSAVSTMRAFGHK